MSDRLKAAFEEASKLSVTEQDQFAEFLMAALQDDQEWTRQFESSQDVLAMLAKEARAEYDAGKTKDLDDLLN